MFRRTFWFATGAAAGVWATTKVNRKIRALSPESLAAQAANKAVDAGHRLKEFAIDVRAGMAQREAELGEALGIEAAPAPELAARRRFAAIEHIVTEHTGVKRTDAGHPRHTHNRNEDH
ncbi:DUF6167 family protein [Streptomyces sp. NBC_00344]|uniref:DUF6167 family protein n=1 Tax=Streptomyces sp. NBC_00344 TaxID=2975720 RepID=UPI002E1DCE12